MMRRWFNVLGSMVTASGILGVAGLITRKPVFAEDKDRNRSFFSNYFWTNKELGCCPTPSFSGYEADIEEKAAKFKNDLLEFYRKAPLKKQNECFEKQSPFFDNIGTQEILFAVHIEIFEELTPAQRASLVYKIVDKDCLFDSLETLFPKLNPETEYALQKLIFENVKTMVWAKWSVIERFFPILYRGFEVNSAEASWIRDNLLQTINSQFEPNKALKANEIREALTASAAIFSDFLPGQRDSLLEICFQLCRNSDNSWYHEPAVNIIAIYFQHSTEEDRKLLFERIVRELYISVDFRMETLPTLMKIIFVDLNELQAETAFSILTNTDCLRESWRGRDFAINAIDMLDKLYCSGALNEAQSKRYLALLLHHIKTDPSDSDFNFFHKHIIVSLANAYRLHVNKERFLSNSDEFYKAILLKLQFGNETRSSLEYLPTMVMEQLTILYPMLRDSQKALIPIRNIIRWSVDPRVSDHSYDPMIEHLLETVVLEKISFNVAQAPEVLLAMVQFPVAHEFYWKYHGRLVPTVELPILKDKMRTLIGLLTPEQSLQAFAYLINKYDHKHGDFSDEYKFVKEAFFECINMLCDSIEMNQSLVREIFYQLHPILYTSIDQSEFRTEVLNHMMKRFLPKLTLPLLDLIIRDITGALIFQRPSNNSSLGAISSHNHLKKLLLMMHTIINALDSEKSSVIPDHLLKCCVRGHYIEQVLALSLLAQIYPTLNSDQSDKAFAAIQQCALECGNRSETSTAAKQALDDIRPHLRLEQLSQVIDQKPESDIKKPKFR